MGRERDVEKRVVDAVDTSSIDDAISAWKKILLGDVRIDRKAGRSHDSPGVTRDSGIKGKRAGEMKSTKDVNTGDHS